LPGKGVNILGDALSQLKTENWKLLVVGDGSERAPFERALAEHGLLDRTEFTGAISYSAVPLLFQKIDILAVPTETTKRIREQFGRVIVEAMASGIPVIGSTCGAIPEVIDTAGLVVREGDAMALAEGLRKLLADPELRERLARAGRRRVEEHYTWERVAEQTYDLYQLVLRTHPVKARAQNFGFATESEGRLIS
jgi:glycosyltransferase involved in cell wall biosynthesis